MIMDIRKVANTALRKARDVVCDRGVRVHTELAEPRIAVNPRTARAIFSGNKISRFLIFSLDHSFGFFAAFLILLKPKTCASGMTVRLDTAVTPTGTAKVMLVDIAADVKV